MSTSQPMIYLIYNDEDAQSLINKLQFLDFAVTSHPSVDDFLNDPNVRRGNACILTELSPEGIDFQSQLTSRNIRLPIIFTSRNPSAELTIDSIKNGASSVIDVPIALEKLQTEIRAAITATPLSRAIENLRDQHTRFNVLSDRERNIACMIAGGQLNKQIASKLGLSIRTIEKYRGQVYQLLKVDNTAELTRVVTLAELHQQLSIHTPSLSPTPNCNFEFVA